MEEDKEVLRQVLEDMALYGIAGASFENTPDGITIKNITIEEAISALDSQRQDANTDFNKE